MVTEHTWYIDTSGKYRDQVAQQWAEALISGRQGKLRASKCASPDCRALALWLEVAVPRREGGQSPWVENVTVMVYPQAGVRIPPADGLEPEEVRLYREAAAVAPMSRRAGCALVRVLLEAYLRRQLAVREHSVENKRLVALINMAVDHLDLVPHLEDWLDRHP